MNYTICLPFEADFLELIGPAHLGDGMGEGLKLFHQPLKEKQRDKHNPNRQ